MRGWQLIQEEMATYLPLLGEVLTYFYLFICLYIYICIHPSTYLGDVVYILL